MSENGMTYSYSICNYLVNIHSYIIMLRTFTQLLMHLNINSHQAKVKIETANFISILNLGMQEPFKKDL